MSDKTWHDPNGILRHHVSQIYCTETGVNLVISRSWRARHQNWDYHAESHEMVEFHKTLMASRAKDETQ
jgi:hypothetical protein